MLDGGHAYTSWARVEGVAGEDDRIGLEQVDHVQAVGQDHAHLAQVAARSAPPIVVAGRQHDEHLALRLPGARAARAWLRLDLVEPEALDHAHGAIGRLGAEHAAQRGAAHLGAAASARSRAGAVRRPRRRRPSAAPASVPWRARPVPFWRHGLRPPPRTSPRVSVSAVPRRRPASWRTTAWWMSASLTGAAKSDSASSTLPASCRRPLRIVVFGIVTSPSAPAAGRCARPGTAPLTRMRLRSGRPSRP